MGERHVGEEAAAPETTDGVPAPAGASMPTPSTPLHIFHPRMVEL